MYKLLHLILNICSFIAFVYIIILLKEIIKYIFLKISKKECEFSIIKFDIKIKNFILFFVIAIGTVNFVLSTWYKQPSIGNFYEKSDYKTNYYIYLYEDNSYVSCKKLPAEIECITDVQETDLYYSTSYDYYKTYYINKVYKPSINPNFPNDFTSDNYINFDSIKIKPNKKNEIKDILGNTYYIELSKEKYLLQITEEKSLEKIDNKMKQNDPYYENSEANK